jgi:hypothetical protein
MLRKEQNFYNKRALEFNKFEQFNKDAYSNITPQCIKPMQSRASRFPAFGILGVLGRRSALRKACTYTEETHAMPRLGFEPTFPVFE